jgi:hypothetical protein
MRAGNLRPEYDHIIACHVHADVRSRIRRYEMASSFGKLDEIFQGFFFSTRTLQHIRDPQRLITIELSRKMHARRNVR